MKTPKIGIIGFGNMGQAIYSRLKSNYTHILVFDHDRSKADFLVQSIDDLEVCDIIILAVKPQNLNDVAHAFGFDLKSKVVISILAGISLDRIRQVLKCTRVVRSMPNLGVSIGKSVTGWISSPNLSAIQKKEVNSIFELFGLAIELKDESQIDAITALSGSGPAYFFYLTELLETNAQDFGFDKQTAQLIARYTVSAAADMIFEGQKSPHDWKLSVCSRGGTTEVALKFMESKNFDTIFAQAINTAFERARELNQNS